MTRIPIRLSAPRKYGNRKTVVDNITFDSAKEANRYKELKLLQKGYKIFDLALQPRYALIVNGTTVCDYIADFRYYANVSDAAIDANPVVEDCKGFRTREYKLKKKLMKAIHGIEIQEV